VQIVWARLFDVGLALEKDAERALKPHGFLWQADLRNADAMFRQGLTSRIITAKHAALAMMPAKRGLLVEVTENDIIGGGANPSRR